MAEINIDSTYGVIIVQDMQAVDVDENYARIYGYDSATELLDNIDSFLDLIAPELHQQVIDNCSDIISGKITPRGQTFANIDRNGREFTVFCVVHLIEWQGRPALQTTVIDMTAIVDANKRVREKDRMFKQLIMQSGQGIMVHRNFKPLMINQSWIDLMHAESIEQVMALDSLLDLIPEPQREETRLRYQGLISGEIRGESKIIENVCFDGEVRFFNIYDNLIVWDGEPALQVVLEDVTERVKLEQMVAYRAAHDELTDLYNRRAMYDWLDQKALETCGKDLNLVCMLMDIDDFKMVNDNFGHLSGDKVIRALADTVKEIINPVDGAVGRWGGEEFIAFIPGINIDKATQIAEQIRSQFGQLTYQNDHNHFSATVSIGISTIQNCCQSGETEALIRAADSQLYLAKAHGKNRVRALKQ